jgi:uncharacterized membrane protein
MADNRKKLTRRERTLKQNQQDQQSAPPAAATYIAATQYQFNQASLVPLAEELANLEQVSPGLGERAFTMAERQQLHRHNLEEKAVTAGIRRATRGQWFAFIIAMSAIGGGIYLSSIGQTTKGVVAIVGALATLVGLFLYAHRSGRTDLQRKDPRRVKQ